MQLVMKAVPGWMIARARAGPSLLRGRIRAVGQPRRHVSSQFGPASTIPGQDQDDEDASGNPKSEKESKPRFGPTMFKVFETAATTFASIAVLGLAGYSYHVYYKSLVLRKITKAFAPGDPMLDLASPPGPHVPQLDPSTDDTENWIQRTEQTKIDAIINGEAKGRYYLLVGEKGTGKSSMLLEAMRQNNGEGVSMFEAHGQSPKL